VRLAFPAAALVVTMVEPAFRCGLMALVCQAELASAGCCATGVGAVGVAAITASADVEQGTALTAKPRAEQHFVVNGHAYGWRSLTAALRS